MSKRKHKCHDSGGKKWYHSKLNVTVAIVLALLFVSYNVPVLSPFYDAFMDYLGLIWWAILLGLFLGGVMDYFVPKEYVSKMLAQKKKKTIFYATIFGFIMAACSHGILAISMELYKKGASIASVIAFLLAAPWANMAVTIMLFGFFGIKALFLIVSAIVVAIITGMIYQILERKGLVEKSKSVKVAKEFSIRKDVKRRWKKYTFSFSNVLGDTRGVLGGMWSLSQMVLWWILIGMTMASLARGFIPIDFFQQYLGASIIGLILTLVLATIIEVCSEGSSPMAFEIYRQTGAFGNAFVFLMAGVATDYTEIGLIWSNIGKKAALWLPVITVPQIVILGYIFNVLL
tara:strand:+ start:8755 stop:9789 length:1035 start_codon:yes stop_codon:yes gene_type:complete